MITVFFELKVIILDDRAKVRIDFNKANSFKELFYTFAKEKILQKFI